MDCSPVADDKALKVHKAILQKAQRVVILTGKDSIHPIIRTHNSERIRPHRRNKGLQIQILRRLVDGHRIVEPLQKRWKSLILDE